MDKPFETVFGGLNEKSFKYLLIILLAMFFIVPLVGDKAYTLFPWFTKVLNLGMFLAILWGSSNVASKNPRVYFTVIAASLVALGLNGLYIYWPYTGLMLANHVIISVILIQIIFSLTRYLFVCKDVTHYTLFAAVSSFLLIALLWAMFYGIIEMIDPGAFNVPEELSVTGSLSSLGKSGSFMGLYFSIVTITTLGYGDISPLTTEARMIATAEAFVGQMYVAVTIARLVGIYTSKSLLKKED